MHQKIILGIFFSNSHRWQQRDLFVAAFTLRSYQFNSIIKVHGDSKVAEKICILLFGKYFSQHFTFFTEINRQA